MMRISKSETPEKNYAMDERQEDVEAEIDLGIITDNELSFKKHFSKKIKS